MIKTLVKNRLSALFGSAVGRARKGKEIKKASTAKIVLFSILYLYIAVVSIGLSIGLSYLLSKFLLPGAAWLYYLVIMGISVTLVFVLGIFETKTELFECKDNDLLLSMPIKPRDIVAARIIIVLLLNYVINTIVTLPAIIFYGAVAKDAAGVIGGILVFLFLPILSTALASFVGYFVAELSRKLKFKNLVIILVSLVFIGLYLWFVEVMSNNIEEILMSLAGFSESLAKNYKILLFIGEAALLKPLSTLAVVGASIIAGVIAYTVISSSYIRIVTNRTGARKAVYKEKKLKTRSAIFALTKKDIIHFFSSPMYVLNGALGLIFSVGIGVFLIVKRETLDMLMLGLGFSPAAVSGMVVAMIGLTAAMSIISACALSIEGKCFWIMKSLPISGREALISKALMQFVISLPPLLIASVLVIIALSPAPALWLIYLLIPQLFNALFSILGILINVAFPKFTYQNEAQAVKQSMSTLVSMMTSMLISAGLVIGIFFISQKSVFWSMFLLVGVPVVLLPIVILLLMYPAAKRYESLNL